MPGSVILFLGGASRQTRDFSNFEGFDFNSTGSNSFGDIFETLFGSRQSQARGRERVPEPAFSQYRIVTVNFIVISRLV
ncbi:MAG: hypothetical protein KAW12_18460 [Candidatus Aminicenantes bacterium]|nr:hypothetical protein [Candidatus Aminicenantes bacterium]